MRKTSILAFLCLHIVAFGDLGLGPSPAKFTVKVIDEDGKPVTNAPISAGFVAEENRDMNGATDSNGMFIAQCDKVISGEAGFSVNCNVLGSYPTFYGLRFLKIVNGRWEPWNPIATCIVRRIVNPIPMYAKKVEMKMPVLDKYVGFDLMKADWVSPYGKGETVDLAFRMKNTFTDIRHFDTSLELAFTNVVDGIQEVSLSSFPGSAYRLPRLSPLEGYSTIFLESESGTNYFKPNLDQSFLFRVRSVTNSEGNIVSALYGKIRGCIGFDGRWSKTGSIQFAYYLNPTPNDRNLEFDPKRNLFTNLKPMEQVTEP